MKVGTGSKTGVELRYHKGAAYNNLSKEEKSELREWQESLGPNEKVPGTPNREKKGAKGSNTKGKSGGKKVSWGTKKIKSHVASLVKREQREF